MKDQPTPERAPEAAAPIFDIANVLSGAWKPMLDLQVVPDKLAQLRTEMGSGATGATADGAEEATNG